MGNVKTTSEQIQLIYRIAGSVVGDCIPNLMELLHYRKEVAKMITKAEGHAHESLMENLNYTNEQIKKLLGL